PRRGQRSWSWRHWRGDLAQAGGQGPHPHDAASVRQRTGVTRAHGRRRLRGARRAHERRRTGMLSPMTRPLFFRGVLAALLVFCACKKADDAPPAQGDGDAAGVRQEARTEIDPHAVLTPELLREHTRALSEDTMQGRAPGTEGGKRAVAYIIDQMKSLGLEPAGDGGDYTQVVAMRSVTLD